MQQPTLKRYVEFFLPVLGEDDRQLLMQRAGVHEIETRNINALKIPPHAYGLQFYDKLELEWDWEGQKQILESRYFNYSPRFYFGGQVFDRIEDLQRILPPDHGAVLLMKANPSKKVIKTSIGVFETFGENDRVIKL